MLPFFSFSLGPLPLVFCFFCCELKPWRNAALFFHWVHLPIADNDCFYSFLLGAEREGRNAALFVSPFHWVHCHFSCCEHRPGRKADFFPGSTATFSFAVN